MPTLTINGRKVTAPEGATILEAARSTGIDIPTFCWYPKLPVVGNCRICLVSVEGNPKLIPSCAAKAEEGQVVTTESMSAVANRKAVLSMLLERYPVDDIPEGAARNEFEEVVRRYGVPTVKRSTLPLRQGDEREGDPLIQHDMSTCIMCTRCVRACADLQVIGVLDVAMRGEHAEIIVGADGNPEHAGCTWCGECVRVCPTGAIHDIIPLAKMKVESLQEPAHKVRSVCPYCAVGCQVDLEVRGNDIQRVVSPWIEENTPNQGSTCVKGRFGFDFAMHRDRLTKPLIRRGWVKRDGQWSWEPSAEQTEAWGRRGGPWRPIQAEGRTKKRRPKFNPLRALPLTEAPLADARDRVATPAEWYEPFREATWEEAMDLTASQLTKLRNERGPESIAVFSSAKCTNEENYLISRFIRAGMGSNNIDHCTRMCHASSVSAMQRSMNTSAATGSMREVEHESDVIFILGANTTESHPVFGAAIKRAQRRGAKLIVADPRRIELAARADIHLQMLPGTDVALLNSMLNHILAMGLENREYINAHTHGFDVVAEAVKPYTPERGEAITGISADLIRAAAETYARGPKSATLWAMGLTQHHTGTDIVTSLLNLLLSCGMIGRWGAPMMPIRGQNNVQGAGDMGAAPMTYSDYRSISDPAVRAEHAKVWGVPEDRIPLQEGLKATEVVMAGSPVHGMYIMGENPMLSDPDVSHAEAWFRELDFLVVQDLFLTETARYGDVVFPGASFAEKTGTFVNTERRIQIAHKAIEPPGEARSDLDILIELSNRVGLPSPYAGASEVMDEIAQLTPSWRGVSYSRLEGPGMQYPVPDADSPGTPFLFANGFPTSDGKATLVPVEFLPPNELPDDEFPFFMNTGRQLYHWHTGTMSRRSTGLDSREPTPTVEISVDDARELGISDGDPLRITSRRGSMIINARVSERVAHRQVFVPMHYREAAANLLTNASQLDPYAKIPEFKVSAVRVEAVKDSAPITDNWDRSSRAELVAGDD